MNALPKLRRTIGLLAILAALGLMAAACGSEDVAAEDPEAPSSAEAGSTDEAETTDEGETTDADETTDEGGAADETTEADGEEAMDDGSEAIGEYPRTIDTEAGAVTVESQPQSIVSLSATATEMLFAIGAGDSVVAVDTYSNYPPEAPEPTLDGFTPDLEAILANSPDLVVASGLPEDVSAGLTGAGVTVMILSTAGSIDDTFDQIAQLGLATDQIDGAASTNAEIQAGISAVVDNLPNREEPVRVFHEIDDSFYTATSNSFIGDVYGLMGFENVADPLDDGSGFPLVDGESIIAADPTLIVFTTDAAYAVEDITSRPGWETITAVNGGNVVQVDADIASRWGPRVVDFMEVLAAEVTASAG